MSNLTEGAIARITSGGVTAAELKPTLQVTELKQVQTKQPQQSDRFRLVLSDGTHLQQAMLGTQINHLVKDGHLRPGSVVQLVQYTCTTVQGRMIIIILELAVIIEECALIGNPISVQKSAAPPSMEQPGNFSSNPRPSVNNTPGSVALNSSYSNQNSSFHNPKPEISENATGFTGSVALNSSYSNQNSGFRNPKPEISRPYQQPPPHSSYQQPPPVYTNRGPVARNEAPPRIIPIAALNPYQGRWTIKARVTAKAELRHYNNPRGDGKVFSFDLLDSDGGEIRVTCFNAVADQFYHQIEAGRVYLISKGSLKPAQKTFNHLRNDLEIFLESSSIIQPCFDDDSSIPRQQFHFRPISDIEGMDNNTVVDVIGVVSSISPATSIMRKNGSETQKRALQLKDMSGRSVEITLWGNFCSAEGQMLQTMCDTGSFPVLAVKSGRVSDFNGKALGTISTSQLFIEPDFPEAQKLKDWFNKEGRNTPTVSISKELSSVGRTDVLKTVSQIKDERLGTSEKPDWITVNATVIFIKVDNFCYTACPIMAGDRPCSKKVTNNGDGKWRCEKCDQSVDACDYRYILQIQIQDHTGITWVTAFQECGEEIMGVSAKDLHCMKFEKQDDESFSKIIRQVLFTRYFFKLKVKEETFSDEQRVKSTVVKAEKMNYSSLSRSLLDLMEKSNSENSSSASKAEYGYSTPGGKSTGIENFVNRQAGVLGSKYLGNQYNIGFPTTVTSGAQPCCSSCGATGHSSANCPSIMNTQGQSVAGSFANRVSSGAVMGGATGECYKCHQIGHWARDCPGLSTIPPAYGGGGISSGRFGGMSRQQLGGF
ncbi:hypothetical protein K2173_009408 [Erythroxylum novogranatense]|uniref:Replication protein A subunit n=1 Tax=Erythroxylum novogranatense TaxID=1862640 RepID=A0AAV8U3U2_9ROSI|nr:hypothetical protein K2173_009408 [Erythroxylum novogranatense]